jgi:salicylate hydroxylase
VYEQARALTSVGAGLMVSPNAARLLRRLGVLDAFARTAVPLQTGWEFRRWQDASVLFSQALGPQCRSLYGEDSWGVHRADLLATLRSAVDPDAVRLGARCTAVAAHDDHAVVTFADDTTDSAPVVIGADGMHSVIAEAIGEPVGSRFAQLCAFRSLVPAQDAPEFARRPAHTLWLGPDRHLVHYPISGGTLINLVAVTRETDWRVESWSTEGSVEDLEATFDGWDPGLRALIRAAPGTGRWALFDRDPRTRWVHGPLALLGDAAHPMFPFLAQGAAQAIEDAAALALHLAAQADPRAGLRAYEHARIGRATQVQLASRGPRESNNLPDGPEQRARDERIAGLDPLRHNGWLYAHDAGSPVAVG